MFFWARFYSSPKNFFFKKFFLKFFWRKNLEVWKRNHDGKGGTKGRTAARKRHHALLLCPSPPMIPFPQPWFHYVTAVGSLVARKKRSPCAGSPWNQFHKRIHDQGSHGCFFDAVPALFPNHDVNPSPFHPFHKQARFHSPEKPARRVFPSIDVSFPSWVSFFLLSLCVSFAQFAHAATHVKVVRSLHLYMGLFAPMNLVRLNGESTPQRKETENDQEFRRYEMPVSKGKHHDLPDRSWIERSGPDRARTGIGHGGGRIFLHRGRQREGRRDRHSPNQPWRPDIF